MTHYQRAVRSAAICLIAACFCVTGIGKLLTSVDGGAASRLVDPLLMVPHWVLLPVVGIGEVLLAVLLLSRVSEYAKSLLIMYASGLMLMYHGFNYVMGTGGHCPCLGKLVNWLPLSDETVRVWLRVTVVGMFLCSVWLSRISQPQRVK